MLNFGPEQNSKPEQTVNFMQLQGTKDSEFDVKDYYNSISELYTKSDWSGLKKSTVLLQNESECNGSVVPIAAHCLFLWIV